MAVYSTPHSVAKRNLAAIAGLRAGIKIWLGITFNEVCKSPAVNSLA